MEFKANRLPKYHNIFVLCLLSVLDHVYYILVSLFSVMLVKVHLDLYCLICAGLQLWIGRKPTITLVGFDWSVLCWEILPQKLTLVKGVKMGKMAKVLCNTNCIRNSNVLVVRRRISLNRRSIILFIIGVKVESVNI